MINKRKPGDMFVHVEPAPNSSQQKKRKSNEDWEKHKPFILAKVAGSTLEETLKFLKDKIKFEITYGNLFTSLREILLT